MEISFYLKRPKAIIETTIFARISYDGYQTKYYIPEKINPKFWNTKNHQASQSKKFPEAPEFNQRLKNITSDIANAYRTFKNDNKGDSPTPEKLKLLLDNDLKKKVAEVDKIKTLFGFFEDMITQSKTGARLQPKTGQPYSKGTIKAYTTTLNHLIAFQATKKRKIDFKTVDFEFYTDFVEYLSKTLKMASNSIGKCIKNLKTVLNEATERGVNTNMQYKSRKFSTISEQTNSIYLNDAEILELENLDLSDNKRLEKVRDLFLVGCFTGMRFSDFSILSAGNIKDGYIEITQTKTGEHVVIPLHHTVKKIIEKYNGELPKSISNQKTNDYLKDIADLAPSLKKTFTRSFTKGGLKVTRTFEKRELLTTHTARRSFASNEYLHGTPAITIMAITGHKTEKSFLLYIKLTPNEHAKLLKLHWDKRNELKAV